MKNKIKILYVAAILALSFASLSVNRIQTMAQVQGGYVRFVREIETAQYGVDAPVGLAYSPEAEAFFAVQEAPGGVQALAVVSMYEKRTLPAALNQPISTSINMTFDHQANRLLILDANTQGLLQVAALDNGSLTAEIQSTAGYNLQAVEAGSAQGMAVDPAGGRLFILDAAGKQIWVSGPGSPAVIDLQSFGDAAFRGLAFNPSDGHLYLMNRLNKNVYQISEAGSLVATYDLSALPIDEPQGMLFAPSADMTDDPGILNLFIADSGAASGGRIIEVSFTEPQFIDLPEPQQLDQLVNTIRTSLWAPPSPDPAGIDGMPNGNLIVVDSEIDEPEMEWLFEGTNAWIIKTNGEVVETCPDLYNYNKEPTGLAVNFDNGDVIIADDNWHGPLDAQFKRINIATTFCTNNDNFYRVSITEFGSADPEALAYGKGTLFIGDGVNAEVYAIDPGKNGVFDGHPDNGGDDTVTHFDTQALGIFDLEGMTYHRGRDSLFLISRVNDVIVEVSRNGEVRNTFSVAFLNLVGVGGLGSGPGSINPNQINLFLSDRGVDNNQDPQENDGIIYELAVPGGSNQPPGPLDNLLFLPFVMQSLGN